MLADSGYKVTEQLFNNGLTIIYRGNREADGQKVIIKTLNKNYPSFHELSRFKREYEVTSKLKYVESVGQVYTLVENQNSLMMVLEDTGNKTLKELFFSPESDKESNPDNSKKETISIDIGERLAIAINITHAINQIHQNGVIHKDISPDNIMLNQETGEVKIIDFGISSLLPMEHNEFQNHTQLEGKLAYMSPEQTGRINRALDHRSDLYSLGVTLYQLFTGSRPFLDCDGIELIHAHIAKTTLAPHLVNKDIPLTLSQIIQRLLAKMAEDRYQTAKGLKHDLERCQRQWQCKDLDIDFPLGEYDQSPLLLIQQKLYGRENEVSRIIGAFNYIAQGNSEILFVSGSSGTGKSALVHEVHKPLTEKRGVFISGKFDQNHRDIPFFGWSQAFESFADFLLKEDEASLSRWKTLILHAVGDNGQILADISRSFELIIGKQPKLPKLSGSQALNRFNYTIKQFIKAMARAEHPLVVFIDDWQWADAASISLLKLLAEDTENKHFLFINAYRDNVVNDTHPFAQVLKQLAGKESTHRSAPKTQTIHLGNLAESDTYNLINDALQNPDSVHELAELVYEKTQGNAFFLIQFLEMLQDSDFIRFDMQKNYWLWDIEKLRERNITNNVIELMVANIQQLPADSQEALKFAACIGNRFKLSELSHILDLPLQGASDAIALPLKEGILKRLKTNSTDTLYQFIHDRVQQAAYSLVDEQTRVQVHHRIALNLLLRLSSQKVNEIIFVIVHHLNISKPCITKSAEIETLISLNFEAGKKAKQATAYETALGHFKHAIDALHDNKTQVKRSPGNQTSKNQAFEHRVALYIEAAEVAYLLTQFEQMEEWLECALHEVSTPLSQAQVWSIRLQAYTAQNRLSEAIDASLCALKLLNITIPKTPSDVQVLFSLFKTKWTLKGQSCDDLLDLPPMRDPEHLLAMNILGHTVPAAYWTSPNLVAMIIFTMTQSSVNHGYAPISGYAFSWWGITECAMLGNIDQGSAYGELGIKLAEKHHLYLQQPVFFSGWMINNYQHALRDSFAILDKAYAISLEKGDFEYASYALNNRIQAQFHAGESLSTLLPEMEAAHRNLEDFKMASSLYWHDICWQLSLTLSGGGASEQQVSELVKVPRMLVGEVYDERVSLTQHLKENDASTLFFLYFAKLMQSYLFGDITQAIDHAQTLKGYLKAGIGTFQHRLFYFYDSLSLLAQVEEAPLKKAGRLRRVRANQKMLNKWAQFAPMNHLHHWHLVEAELMRVTGKQNQSLHHYSLAIELASKNYFLHEEALAHELLTKFHISQNQPRYALQDLKQAHYLYLQWGAKVKAAQLQQQYVHLFPEITHASNENIRRETIATRTRTYKETKSTSTSASLQFDLSAVIKASQLIAGEIIFDDLIKTLSSIIIENSGAQKFLMLRPREDGFTIDVESSLVEGEIVTTLPSHPKTENDSAASIPLSLASYVQRTQRTVVLDDATIDNRFSNDAYLNDLNAKSVFCGPILHQGQLTGVIYLENKLTSGVFTPERIEVIQLLSSQAAISIENAKLYTNLENKVWERTQQLEQSLGLQKQLNSSLLESNIERDKAHRQRQALNEKLQEANEKLTLLSNTDSLTQLANRHHFDVFLMAEIGRARREQQQVLLLLCDIDNFKKYNDTYGHIEGDECLKKVGKAFADVFQRASDLPARYGGEEFAVILTSTDIDHVMQVAENLRAAIQALNILHEKNEAYGVVTISIGCHFLVPDKEQDIEPQVENLKLLADEALYQAKDNGRNCVFLKS